MAGKLGERLGRSAGDGAAGVGGEVVDALGGKLDRVFLGDVGDEADFVAAAGAGSSQGAEDEAERAGVGAVDGRMFLPEAAFAEHALSFHDR